MFLFGPLWKTSCIRFESKHFNGKTISKSTKSRVNINKTIAIKHQVQQSLRFIFGNDTNPNDSLKTHMLELCDFVREYAVFKLLCSLKKIQVCVIYYIYIIYTVL